MTNNVTDQFVDELFNLTRTRFQESVIFQAKKCLLDYLGVTLAGARMLEGKADALLNSLGSVEEKTSVIGFNRKASLQNAALVNGMCAHVAELDDGVRFGMMHPGATVLSALLPLAEHEELTGTDLLTGIITGYEAAIRLASAIQPAHRNRGYHATGTCGTIGAAVGATAALGFTESQMKNTLSVAATAASGMLKVIKDGSELKPFNAGNAAASGLVAAFMAQAGFEGPDDVLEGEWGLISMMTETSDLSLLERKTSEPLGIEKIYVKLHAACRHCHPAIEAALRIRQKTGIQGAQIKNVIVTTYGLAAGGHDHTLISGINSAKMSTPYSVAVALMTGRAGIQEFSEKQIVDAATLSLAQKVVVSEDEALSALVPGKRPAIVRITTSENECYTERVDLTKGEPENPISVDELQKKFISLAEYGNKTQVEASQIIRYVWNLESDLGRLFPLL